MTSISLTCFVIRHSSFSLDIAHPDEHPAQSLPGDVRAFAATNRGADSYAASSCAFSLAEIEATLVSPAVSDRGYDRKVAPARKAGRARAATHTALCCNRLRC